MKLVSQPIMPHITRKRSTDQSLVLMEEKCLTSCNFHKQCLAILIDIYEKGDIKSESYLAKVKKIVNLITTIEESRSVFKTFCAVSFLDRYHNPPVIMTVFNSIDKYISNWTMLNQLEGECIQLLTRMSTIENLSSMDTDLICLLCNLCRWDCENTKFKKLLFEVARSVWPYINRPLWGSEHFVDFVCDIMEVVGEQLETLYPKNFKLAWKVIHEKLVGQNVEETCYTRLRLLAVIEHKLRMWSLPAEIIQFYKQEYEEFLESRKKEVFSVLGYLVSRRKTSLSVKPGRSAADFLKRKLSSESQEKERLLSSNSDSSECLSEVFEDVVKSDKTKESTGGSNSVFGAHVKSIDRVSETKDFSGKKVKVLRSLSETTDISKPVKIEEYAGNIFRRHSDTRDISKPRRTVVGNMNVGFERIYNSEDEQKGCSSTINIVESHSISPNNNKMSESELKCSMNNADTGTSHSDYTDGKTRNGLGSDSGQHIVLRSSSLDSMNKVEQNKRKESDGSIDEDDVFISTFSNVTDSCQIDNKHVGKEPMNDEKILSDENTSEDGSFAQDETTSSETSSCDNDQKRLFFDRRTVITMKVPNKYVGRIIGTRGSVITYIQEESGTKIRMVREKEFGESLRENRRPALKSWRDDSVSLKDEEKLVLKEEEKTSFASCSKGAETNTKEGNAGESNKKDEMTSIEEKQKEMVMNEEEETATGKTAWKEGDKKSELGEEEKVTSKEDEKEEEEEEEEEKYFEIKGTDKTIRKAKQLIEDIIKHAKKTENNRIRLIRSFSEVTPTQGGFKQIYRSLSCPIQDWGESCEGSCSNCQKASYCRAFLLSQSESPGAWVRPDDLSLTRDEDWTKVIVKTEVNDLRRLSDKSPSKVSE